MSAYGYGGRPDHRLQRRELQRRVAHATAYYSPPKRGSCGCGCGTCDGKRQAPQVVEERAAICTSSVCVTERDGGEWISGTAHLYETWSSSICDEPDRPERCFREIIAVGAFDDALRRSDLDVLFVVNHDANRTLARATARPGNDARLWADRRGLHFEFLVPTTPLGRRVLGDLRAGQIRGTSFSMGDITSTWSEAADGTLLRRITRIGRLDDITLADRSAAPAYSFAAPSPVAA